MSRPVDPYPTDEQVQQALASARRELERVGAPDPRFRAALRTRLLAVHAVDPPEAVPTGPAAWYRRGPRLRTTLIAGALSLAVGLTGVGVATTRSLPGQPLYGAKRAVEALRLRTADGPLDTGLAHLHLAERRVREVRALAQGRDWLALGPAGSGAGPVLASGTVATGGRVGAVREALDDLDRQAATGSGLVLQVARDTGDPTPLRVLQAWSGQQVRLLADVTGALPGPVRDQALASVSVLAGVGSRATALLGPAR